MPLLDITTGQDGASALYRMMHPRGMAIVGVSGREGSLNARPLRYLREHGFEGAVYPVNPNYEELQGLRCYPTLADVPGPVDLVLILVPASQTAQVVREAGAAGAAGVVVFASGFAESGPHGRALQEELSRVGRDAGVRVLGPNCQGILYRPARMAATFTAAAARPLEGRSGVAYVGQSGAVGGSVLDLATEMGLGLTAWVSTGNQADLDLIEVASALVTDDAVEVVMIYAEAIGDGAAYTRLARQARAAGKHLVVLLSGRSDAGRRAAASHTGSMLRDDAGFVLTSRRYGVIVVDDVDELLAVAATVRSVPDIGGRHVAVITTSGGAGSLAADHCAAHDLELPELDVEVQRRLASLVPDFGAVSNPVDVTAQLLNLGRPADALFRVCSLVAADPDVDVVGVVLTMVTGSLGAELAEALVEVARDLDKPLFVTWLAGHDQTLAGRGRFREAGMPVFSSVGDFARTAGLLASVASSVRDDRPAGPDAEAKAAADLLRDFANGRARGEQLLRALGIAMPRSVLATNALSATEAAEELGGTVAMKVHARSQTHKSDIGGVRLGVAARDVGRVFSELENAAAHHGVDDLAGVLVQQMTPSGVELIVGAVGAADGFPPTITVGVGGVTTEIYGDVTSELAPVTRDEAEAMLRRLHGWPLLSGFRGRPPADVTAAAEAVASVSRAVTALGDEPFEFEINPLIVASYGRGASGVDVLARIPARHQER